MNRDRVIVDFDTLGEALKVEETIKTGYCDTISENLLQWIAVEEDLAESYDKMVQQTHGELKRALADLESESRSNIALLQTTLSTTERLGEARGKRKELIEKLIQKT